MARAYRRPHQPRVVRDSLLEKIAIVTMAIIMAVALVWVLILKPILDWATQNLIFLICVGAVLVFALATIGYFYFMRKKKFEDKQRAKGLEKFVDRHGKEFWVKAEEVNSLREKDEEERFKETLYQRVIEAIRKFEPSRVYHNEFGYHTELQGALKTQFPNARVEMQTGASRPDIVIEDIAIEVKGPTDNNALNTLTTKCLKYSQYYKKLIIVLFEPQFSEQNMGEIASGIKQYFPNVEIIRK